MTKVVRIATGYSNVPLPNGRTYNQGPLISLTDAEYAAIPPAVLQMITLVSSSADPANLPAAPNPPSSFTDTLMQIVGPLLTQLESQITRNSRSFSVSGILTVNSYAMRLYVDDPSALDHIRVSVGTAPVGSPIIVDVLKNGSTVFPTTAKPTIAPATNTATATPDITSLLAGDYLTVNVVQIGSSTPGSDLTVQVFMS